MSIKSGLKETVNKMILRMYRRKIPAMEREIRRKDVVKVLFLLYDVSKWKTEPLYRRMLQHPRFDPRIEITVRVCDQPAQMMKNYQLLTEYLKEHGYDYRENTRYIGNDYDIVVYQEPYPETLPEEQRPIHNLNKLMLQFVYGFHITRLDFELFQPLHFYTWFDSYEDRKCAVEAKKRIHGRRRNILLTGLPMSDMLLDKSVPDPWKPQSKRKKRIIWAPHHSLPDNTEGGIHYATFPEIAEEMLAIAEKYSEQIQWAFKPHPLLRMKLNDLWGEQRTNEYYRRWETMENTQAEYGSYVGLFRHSDAMVHDSCSFVVEYLFMDKPVMFMNTDPQVRLDMNSLAKDALDVAEMMVDHSDIEEFVKRVLAGDDRNAGKRRAFMTERLIPAGGVTATDNVISAILGEKEFERF